MIYFNSYLRYISNVSWLFPKFRFLYIKVDLLPKLMNAPEGVVRVSEANAASFIQDISAGGHHLVADEPESYGGDFLVQRHTN